MRVQREHRRAFIDGMQGLASERERRIVDRRLRNEYEPLYIEAAATVLYEVASDAATSLARELGIPPDQVPNVVDDIVEYGASRAGQEAFNRAQGWYREQMVNEIETGNRTRIALLAAATLAAITSKAVSAAYEQGRESAIDIVVDVSSGPIKARRTAILDKNTCEECQRLHGSTYVYDSDAYHANKPPAWCEGLHRCRCQMEYIIPLDFDAEDPFDAEG